MITAPAHRRCGCTRIIPIRLGSSSISERATVQNFDLARGDKLDLTKLLSGAPLAADLTNVSDFVRVLAYAQNDTGYASGTQTALDVTGPGGHAVVHLEGSGKLDLQALLAHNSLILPPH